MSVGKMRKYLQSIIDWKKTEITQFLHKILLQVEFIKLKVLERKKQYKYKKTV